MVSGTVEGTGADGDVAAGGNAVEQPPDDAFGASVISVATLALGLAGACALIVLDGLVDPHGGGGGDVGAMLAFSGFVTSNLAALFSWARLRRRTVRRWLVVLPARSWGVFWGSLATLYLITSGAPSTVVSRQEATVTTAFGWPRPWVVQELQTWDSEPASFSLSRDTVSHVYADPFWASWFVAAVVFVCVGALLLLAYRFVSDGQGRHRVVRGGPPEDGSLQAPGEPAAER